MRAIGRWIHHTIKMCVCVCESVCVWWAVSCVHARGRRPSVEGSVKREQLGGGFTTRLNCVCVCACMVGSVLRACQRSQAIRRGQC